MYSLNNSVASVRGIGPNLTTKLANNNISTIKDLLFHLPLRYEDRSQIVTIDQLQEGELVTFKAEVNKTNLFRRGRRTIFSAMVADETGRIKCMWFNNRFISTRLKEGESYFFSGKLNNRHTIIQPIVEDIRDETLHTGRLVPVYSSMLNFKQGSLRRILKEIVDHLSEEKISDLQKIEPGLLPITKSLQQLHFPDAEEEVIKARERLALEELISLIITSKKLKQEWARLHTATAISSNHSQKPIIPNSIPFTLTGAQKKAVKEILADIKLNHPMNRLLVGDVGSGKTVVAGIAGYHTLLSGHHAALVAPTQILAQQHFNSLQKLFPDLTIKLLTGNNKAELQTIETTKDQPTFFVGTHVVINSLSTIKPALLIYDEQHRFGVKQRSEAQDLSQHPHVLTMTATPIPRSLMLTIFAHLNLSYLDQMPAGRIPTKSWLIPESKRQSAYDWISEKLNTKKDQAFIVCPFIDPSRHEALENVAATTQVFEEIKSQFKSSGLTIEMLHGRLPTKIKDSIITRLFDNQIQVLVTTPIVEVGIDLPQANIMVIEAAERFGMASLHQLRGRVGRAGQKSYCLLFTNSKSSLTKRRLINFSKENDGRKLAEQDLKNRGAGNIFGTEQHGLNQLRFASWTNLELIKHAKKLADNISQKYPNWQSVLTFKPPLKNTIPLAN